MKLLLNLRLAWAMVIIEMLSTGLAIAQPAPASTSTEMLVYIGTYTGARSKGIYVSRFNTETGKLSSPELAAETKNPSFLAVYGNRRFLYAVGEVDSFDGKPTGLVNAFKIDVKTAKLNLVNQVPSGGTAPCHLAIDNKGKCVLVANYSSGSIAAIPIGGADGRLADSGTIIQHEGSSVNPQRQAGPHAHFITMDPANRCALACDLGLDKVLTYRLAASAESGKLLTVNEPPGIAIKPGSGPRHLAFHPNGKLVYLINEMGSTLVTLAYDAKPGILEQVQTVSTLPENFKGENSCAEVQVHPSGKFVYGSNRGDNTIAVFSTDPKSGKLSLVEYQSTQGKTPRHFAIDPSGGWLLAENQDSDSIVVFRIDSKTGRLTPTGQTIQVGAPVCAIFVPMK